MVDSDIKDIKLANTGRLRIEWAGQNMPVLKLINGKIVYDEDLTQEQLEKRDREHGKVLFALDNLIKTK